MLQAPEFTLAQFLYLRVVSSWQALRLGMLLLLLLLAAAGARPWLRLCCSPSRRFCMPCRSGCMARIPVM
jgi:hypothetical protein